MSDLVSRFISEKDVEARKKTQESEGVTEAPYDARSLYERLQVEKERKQEEYETFSSLKNRIHRLDEEEVEYLKTVAVHQQRVEMQNEEEVAELLREAKTARPAPITSSVNLESSNRRSTGSGSLPRNTQRSLLSSVLKRSSPPRSDAFHSCSAAKRSNPGFDDTVERQLNLDTTDSSPTSQGAVEAPAAVSYLPGLANYCISDSDRSSDDSDDSASTDVEDAACTLMEIASTRPRKQKTCSTENG